MWKKYNENPDGKRVGDCTVRAIATATGEDWYTTFFGLAIQGAMMCDMPSGNVVWGAYLKHKGFSRHLIPDTYPDDYTVEDFCSDFPRGVYVLALSSHVVPVVDGCYYDTWESGGEIPVYYFSKEE